MVVLLMIGCYIFTIGLTYYLLRVASHFFDFKNDKDFPFVILAFIWPVVWTIAPLIFFVLFWQWAADKSLASLEKKKESPALPQVDTNSYPPQLPADYRNPLPCEFCGKSKV